MKRGWPRSVFCCMVIGIRLASLVTNDVSRAVPICHVHANDVVLALLKPMLARRSYDPTNGLVSGGPRSITSQSVFFSPRRGLSADELKGCFDWYLANLTNSVRGTVVRSNPMAVAARSSDFLGLGRIGRAKRALRSNVTTAVRGRRPYGCTPTPQTCT